MCVCGISADKVIGNGIGTVGTYALVLEVPPAWREVSRASAYNPFEGLSRRERCRVCPGALRRPSLLHFPTGRDNKTGRDIVFLASSAFAGATAVVDEGFVCVADDGDPPPSPLPVVLAADPCLCRAALHLTVPLSMVHQAVFSLVSTLPFAIGQVQVRRFVQRDK